MDLARHYPHIEKLNEMNARMESIWKFGPGNWEQLGQHYIDKFDSKVNGQILLRILGKTTKATIVAKDSAACGSYTVKYMDDSGDSKEKSTSVERLEPLEEVDTFMQDHLKT